jgi:hypothetical protein
MNVTRSEHKMPEIVCHECLRKGKIARDHTSLYHRNWKWHSFMIILLGLSIISAYYKQWILVTIALGYTYLTIIVTTKPRVK